MIAIPSYTFSLLNIALLTSLIVFILARQPRKLLTWVFAAEMMGFVIFFLAEIAQSQPKISTYAISVWKFILNLGAVQVIGAALGLVYLLRDKRLEKWETAIVFIIIARLVVDIVWLAGHFLPKTPYDCLGPLGFDRSPCLYNEQRAIAIALISELLLGVLFLSTTFKASEPKRSILRRYLLWIMLLLMAGSAFWHILQLTNSVKPNIIPIAPITFVLFLPALRLFLALEEAESGINIAVVNWRVLLWVALLLAAILIDLMWGVPSAPVWTLMVLAGGLTAGLATFLNSTTRHVAIVSSNLDMMPSASDPLPSLTREPLRIFLFGPMRVVRNGETLVNTSQIWRSAKTRSLLAYLALKGKDGATQIELVDALWPHDDNLDRADDQRHRKNLQSYLSTLRRVLEPKAERNSDTFIIRDSERLYLANIAGLWVDIWEFDRLITSAAAYKRQGNQQLMLIELKQLVGLYHSEGLLPDDLHLPIEFLEPRRESYRQQWLQSMRLIKAHHNNQDLGHTS